jgi:hypothetical protein
MKTDISIIKPDGSLVADVPGTEVSWFAFLRLSRAVNSKVGGWNSKTHWKSRGLTILTAPASASFVQKWTAASLSSKTDPKPRKRDFRFRSKMSQSRKSACDLALDVAEKKNLNECAENGLNALLFDQFALSKKRVFYDFGKFLSYEIPLAAESVGQLKIDLFGFGVDKPDGTRFVTIVELKNGKNHGDSPLMALVESICYATQLVRCKRYFTKEVHNLAGELKFDDVVDHFKVIKLVIAAPEAYWKHWGEPAEIEPEMQVIVSRVNAGFGGQCKVTLHCHKLTADDIGVGR